MPTKTKDAATALAEAMLLQLGALRHDNGAYPPKLGDLGRRCGLTTTDEQIHKAVAKKVFKEKAAAVKVDGAVTLDSPVYFKEDVPKPTKPPKGPSVADLAERMLLVLDSQRRLGPGSYPPTLRRLAALCEVRESDANVAKAAGHKILTEKAIVAAKAGAKPALDAPVILRPDLDDGARAVLSALLEFALGAFEKIEKGKSTRTTAFSPKDLAGRLVPDLRNPVIEALERGVAQTDLPGNVAWVLVKSNPLFFLVRNVQSKAPVCRPASNGDAPAHASTMPVPSSGATAVAGPRPHDFAVQFRAAFHLLDRRNGSTNFVKLSDLRRALGGFNRPEFDAGLRSLRQSNEFTLNSHEGLHGTLAADEREAGIHEGGSFFIYASRR